MGMTRIRARILPKRLSSLIPITVSVARENGSASCGWRQFVERSP
jgi:hypothetical protein